MIDRIQTAQDLEHSRKKSGDTHPSKRLSITVCGGAGCQAAGCKEVSDKIKDELKFNNLTDKIKLVTTGCHGFCEQGPIVVIRPDNIFYPKVKSKNVSKIIEKSVVKNEIIEDLLYVDPVSKNSIIYEHEIPFYKKQHRLVFGQNGYIDPVDFNDYLAINGYAAISKAIFKMTPNQVINEIIASGLRGRGGGGFLTGRKWKSCAEAINETEAISETDKLKNKRKIIICNADEGDPGAFMDRSLLEGNPHRIIEGMLIGGYAIGAQEGFVYVRHEYPLAVKHMEIAIKQAREAGMLGNSIMGSDFCFDIRISRGGGAFVCGESTALMASLEGKPGEPRAKYVHTVEQGLFDLPTVLNNVETWANIPVIINDGSDKYSKIGTDDSKGTKIFSLVGKINNTGLVEVPMGISVRDIIYKIGGGIPDGKKFKAVQTGGPSGGCITEDMLDLSVDFQKLKEAGSMMGSGGMIVMDEDTCMVDVAKYFIRFLHEESCGKCVPCREGLKTALDILERITNGNGKEGDIELLEELGDWLTDSSLCALGGSAANPVSSTIKFFKDEYESHIKDHKCPAGVCKELITYSIQAELCNGCRACVKTCSVNAILGKKQQPHVIDASICIKCGACLPSCNKFAIVRG